MATRPQRKTGRFLVLALLFAALCYAGLALPSHADDQSGAINAFVYNNRGVPLERAVVSIYPPDTIEGRFVSPPVARRTTDKNGFSSSWLCSPGRYVIVASSEGYYGYCWPRTAVIPNSLTRVNLRLTTVRLLVKCSHQNWGDEGVSF